MNSRKSSRILFALILSCGMVAGMNAQDVDTRPVRGFMPNMDQLSSSIDNIDVATGKLNLTIPLGSLPRGKGGTGYELNLQYESNIYELEHESGTICYNDYYSGLTTCDDDWPGLEHIKRVSTSGGWRYNSQPYRIEIENKSILTYYALNGGMSGATSPFDCLNVMTLYRYRVVLPDGSEHILYLNGFEIHEKGGGFYPISMSGVTDACAVKHYYMPMSKSGLQTWYTTDGSYLKFEIYAPGKPNEPKGVGRLFFPDGRIVEWENGTSGTVREIDANGNAITFEVICTGSSAECNNGIKREERITNAEGKTIKVEYGIVQSGGWSRDRVSIPGPNGYAVYHMDWKSLLGEPREYDSGVIPFSGGPYVTKSEMLYVGFKGLKYIHLPTATQLPTLGAAPAVDYNSYEFDYWLSEEENCAGTVRTTGLGMLNRMRTPSGSKYRYVYDYRDYLQSEPTQIANGAYVCEKTITTTDPDPDQELKWEFENTAYMTRIKKPDGGETVYNYRYKGGGSWDANLAESIVEYEGVTIKRERKQEWTSSIGFIHNGWFIPANHWMSKEIVSIFGSTNKSAITTYKRDINGNQTEKVEYDWIVYNPNAQNPVGTTIKRKTTYDYYTPSGTLYWEPHNASYWPNKIGPHRLNALKRMTVYEGSSTEKAATEYVYDYPLSSGNVTYERRWDNTKATFLAWANSVATSAVNSQEFRYSYDVYGNLTDKYEPLGNGNTLRTHMAYDDLTGSRIVRVDTAYGVLGQQRSVLYDWYNNGVAIKTKTDGENNLITEYYYDAVGRNTKVQEKHGNTNLRLMQTIYDDVNRIITTKNDLLAYGDGKLQTVTYHDQLGRVKLVQTSEGPGTWITVATNDVYPTGGRRVITTTPYRTLSDPTLEMTCTQYDTLGRVARVSMYKGSDPPTSCTSTTNRTGTTPMIYDAEWTTVTDPAGKVRRQRVDVLGRLVEVVEDPSGLNYVTTYEYDALDNLTKVRQGDQTRSFAYSSLSWLMSAMNPESGPTSYTYHDSGDLKTKTDARQKQTTIEYDGLRRIKTKTYRDLTLSGSDGTPTVTYEYHTTVAPNIGMLKSVSTGAATTSYTYDSLGRPKTSSHTIAGRAGTMTFQYEWYLSGALKKETYPSGKVVNYEVDDAGRTSRAYSGSTNYADLRSAAVGSNAYTADGRKAKVKLGNGLYETYDYRPAGTATEYRLGTILNEGDLTTLEYHFNATRNNGNVWQQKVLRNNNSSQDWAQEFEYDGVNRLKNAKEYRINTISSVAWNRAYSYDRYGNRRVTSTGLANEPLEPTVTGHFTAANNRLNMAGVSYDAAGNQTSYDELTLEYDAEGRNTKVKYGSSDHVTFAYDGEGRRVKKISGGITTYYVYDALGQLAAEYSNQAPSNSGVSYLFTDMLGSVRTITNAIGAVVECYDYLPFGRLLTSGTNGRSAAGCYPAGEYPDSRADEKFTGKKRDNETGLDFFEARYMSAPEGRFMSPDKPLLDQHAGDPQSWNLYAYARNNPLLYADPTGEAIELLGDEEELKKALKFFQGIVGNVGSQLMIFQDKKSFFLEIDGKVDDFINSSEIASDLYKLIDSKETIEFGITDRDLSGKGGAVTFAPGKDGNNENVRVLVNPKQVSIGDRNLRFTPIGGQKWEGYRETPPWNVRPLTPEIATWHEFGHASRYTPGQKDWSKTNQEALDWENRMRQQLYGPLGPRNAPRRIH